MESLNLRGKVTREEIIEATIEQMKILNSICELHKQPSEPHEVNINTYVSIVGSVLCVCDVVCVCVFVVWFMCMCMCICCAVDRHYASNYYC